MLSPFEEFQDTGGVFAFGGFTGGLDDLKIDLILLRTQNC
jgi:hypothetical protein